MPTNRAKAIQNRNKASELNEAWSIGAVQSRYSDDGHWYAQLKHFPAALFDSQGYIYFATEEEYLAAPMNIGKQISVPMPGISALPGYVRFPDTATKVMVKSPDSISAFEGRELLRLHKIRERNQRLVAQKKQTILALQGALGCEVCGFDFASVYGQMGFGFAECHHKYPLWQTVGERETTLEELAIVCSNCHRMLHRRPWPTVEELTSIVSSYA